jgi:chromosome segregation ATPase
MAETNTQDRVAELELQLEEANQKLAAAENANADLSKQLEASRNDVSIQVQARDKDSEMAKKEYFELQEKFEAAEKENAELKSEVAKLQDKNAKYENPSFKHGNDEYEILVKHAKVPGVGPVTAADIAASEDLQNVLVAKQSGIIRKKA